MTKKGFIIPFLIPLFGILTIAVVYYSGISSFFTSDNKEEVKGASVVQKPKNGLGVFVTSTGTWDLCEYLCEDRECAESGTEGKRFKTTSGGETEDFEVALDYRGDFSTYKYVKLLVKPGWGFVSETYNIEKGANFDAVGAEIYTDNDSGASVLIVPIEKIMDVYTSDIASFSN